MNSVLLNGGFLFGFLFTLKDNLDIWVDMYCQLGCSEIKEKC